MRHFTFCTEKILHLWLWAGKMVRQKPHYLSPCFSLMATDFSFIKVSWCHSLSIRCCLGVKVITLSPPLHFSSMFGPRWTWAVMAKPKLGSSEQVSKYNSITESAAPPDTIQMSVTEWEVLSWEHFPHCRVDANVIRVVKQHSWMCS